MPQDAVVYEGNEARVWVADKDHRISSRAIRIGRMSGGMLEVLSGLSVGESVVSGGALFIDRAVRGASAGFGVSTSGTRFAMSGVRNSVLGRLT